MSFQKIRDELKEKFIDPAMRPLTRRRGRGGGHNAKLEPRGGGGYTAKSDPGGGGGEVLRNSNVDQIGLEEI